MATRRRRSFRSRSTRRRRVWARIASGNIAGVQPGATGDVDLLSGFRAADQAGYQPAGVTIGGIRLALSAHFTADLPATDVSAGVAWGIICMDRSVAGANMPNPAVDVHLDWMWWSFMYLFSNSGTIVRWDGTDELQIRSKRRCDEVGESPHLVMGVVGAQPVDASFSSSVLLIMP